MNFILRLLGKNIMHKTVAKHTQGSLLDIKLGFALLRDRRIPLGSKLIALAIGGALMAAFIALELPLEAVWAIVLPGLGLGLDGMLDGAEAVAGPVVFGSLLLPFLAPRPLVMQIRAERSGLLYEMPA